MDYGAYWIEISGMPHFFTVLRWITTSVYSFFDINIFLRKSKSHIVFNYGYIISI